MQIKTALTLVTGIGIGFMIFGEDKYKKPIIEKFKDGMYKICTGEKRPHHEKPVVNYACYYNRPNHSYTKSSNKNDSSTYKVVHSWDTIKNEVIYFTTKELANEFIKEIQYAADSFGTLSVTDICDIRHEFDDYKAKANYTLDNYGWSCQELTGISVEPALISPTNSYPWKIKMPEPHCLD